MAVLWALRRFGGSFFRDHLASQGLADDDEELAHSWQRLRLRRLEPTHQPGPAPLRADLTWVWLVPPPPPWPLGSWRGGDGTDAANPGHAKSPRPLDGGSGRVAPTGFEPALPP